MTKHFPRAVAGPILASGIPAALLRSHPLVQAQGGDPASILAGLTQSLDQFQQRHDGRVGKIESSLDELAAQIQALRLNGVGGGGSAAGGPRSGPARAAIEALGGFVKTGRIEAAMRRDSDPDGGFTVVDELAGEIYSLQRDISPMRRLARVVNTRSASYKQVVNKGGTSSGWVGERASRPETNTPELAELDFPAGEIYANPAVTQLMLDDSEFNIGEWLIGEIGKEFEDQEGAAWVSGTGINKPRGFLAYDTYVGAGNAEYGKIQAVHSGHASGFTASNPWSACVDVLQALKAGHRRNATWLMNSATQGLLSKWVDGEGRPLWQRAITAGAPDMFLGRPVELDENMPDVAANAFPIALGAWREGYLINDRMGARLTRDPYTNKPYVMFYTTKRVGGGVLDFEAIKLLKIAA